MTLIWLTLLAGGFYLGMGGLAGESESPREAGAVVDSKKTESC